MHLSQVCHLLSTRHLIKIDLLVLLLLGLQLKFVNELIIVAIVVGLRWFILFLGICALPTRQLGLLVVAVADLFRLLCRLLTISLFFCVYGLDSSKGL